MTNPTIDPLAIIDLANLKTSGKLKELAQHSALGSKPEWMRELSRNKDWHVRRYLAKNPAIANYPEIIKQLAADKDGHVRANLASNPASPTRTARTNSWQTSQQSRPVPTL